MTQITSFKQIKDIIAPISKEDFCKGDYENIYGQCCFIGHINKSLTGIANPFEK